MARVEAELMEDYGRDGYVVVPDVFSPAEIEALHAEALAICRGKRGRVFDLHSADAGSPAGETDEELLARVLAIHFPHKISPLVRAMLAHLRIVEVLTHLIGPDVKAMQSMLFVKRAGKPGQPWHQDEHFIATRDRSLCGVWIALDDATIDNGCLWVHPGSHAAGTLYPMRPCAEPGFDHNDEAFGFPYERGGGVPVELPAGSAVFLHGHLLHRSLRNRRQSGFRRALVNHYMNAHSLLPWDFGETPRVDWRDIVIVAGEDPYAWKGTEQLARPFVRSEEPPAGRHPPAAPAAGAAER